MCLRVIIKEYFYKIYDLDDNPQARLNHKKNHSELKM